ncbi:MAG: N-acetyl-gamma-glutamyl-phosphate reductase [Clostridiales Family XIII bacterium]|nr:N-acetyl-gamma-glutamyl-phosphate reductase [Clostridiales Family XIII bacterium]
MNARKVFVDGREGTTGLRIFERLSDREDIKLVNISPENRKDPQSRLECMREADVSVLCLPDAASREIVAAADAEGGDFRIIDASTAFRVASGWVYGLPELGSGRREALAGAGRVSVPGCHATGFVLIAGVLIKRGVVAEDYPFCCHSVTGYSGGGKKMIEDYRSRELKAPRQYGLAQTHKHLPEMRAVSGAAAPIAFNPIVADFYSGMLVTVPLHGGLMRQKAGPAELYEIFARYFEGQPLVRAVPPGGESEDGYLAADALAGRDSLELLFFGDEARPVVAARYDNLGKGASGAAIQCMNIMLGLSETRGLKL